MYVHVACIFISAKEVMFYLTFVCLSVCLLATSSNKKHRYREEYSASVVLS